MAARRRKKSAAIVRRSRKSREAIADWPPRSFEGGLPSSSLLPPLPGNERPATKRPFFTDKRRSIATRVSPAHGERVVVGGGWEKEGKNGSRAKERERERDNLSARGRIRKIGRKGG